MAVYTDVSFEDLELFLGDYAIGEPHVFKGIAEGSENSNYYLQTDRGSFILTLYEKRVHASDLPYFLGLMQHLAGHGLSCPTPVAAKNGLLSGTLQGRPAAILTFLDGVSLRRPTPIHCQGAGAALAKLHAAGKDFGMARTNTLGLSGWPQLVQDCAAKADDVQSGLRTLIQTEMDYLAQNWPRDLPQGIIHADLFPDNVLFVEERVSGVIDFYFACNDALAYDLTIMLNAWCFETDGTFNITKSRALLAGYQSERPLEAAERAALPILARGSALRFLLTRLYDEIHRTPGALVRPKDPREFSRRLRFHQNVRGPEAYDL
jgi:homoserine kinase type II